MDFKQAENSFKRLKTQFEGGKLTEAQFKAQLEELMIQDEQGSWWMIGYETEKWYRYNGKDWVQTDPPGTRARKSTPPPLKQEIGVNIPHTTRDDQRSLWKFGKKEILQSAIGLGLVTVLYFPFGPIAFPGSPFVGYWSLAFAIPFFFGVVFGPIVGASVGAGGYIISTVMSFFRDRYYYAYGLTYFDYFSSLSLFGFAVAGFIMGFAKTPSNNFRSFKGILRVELFIILAILARLLLSLSAELGFLLSNFYFSMTKILPSVVLSIILVPISLIAYSFVLSRRKAKT